MTIQLITASSFPNNNSNKQIPAKSIAQEIVEAAIHQKALDIRTLNMHGVSDIADYFVILSGTSNRHVQGIVDRIKEFLGKLSEFPNSVSGYENAQWVLMDYGNVLVHVFLEDARHYYSVDELWQSASIVNWPAATAEQLSRLRTGLYNKFESPEESV